MTNRPVVAGIDGSPAAETAIKWAAAEAVSRGAELKLVHSFVWPLFPVPLGPSDMAPGLRAAADKIVQDSVELARKFEPGVAVEGLRRDGFPSPVLIQASTEADLVVIGSRGLGVTLGALIGSTGLDLSANAQCPVVVVRPGESGESGRRVVIGYDGSSASSVALDFGLEYAARHGLPVRVVAAQHLVVDDQTAHPDLEAEIRRRVDSRTATETPDGPLEDAGLSDQDPAEVVRVEGHPAEQILRLAADASLIVIGSRGRGGFAGMMLGSVSQTVLHHATCPVAVIPAAAIGG